MHKENRKMLFDKNYEFDSKLRIRHMTNVTMIYNEEKGEMYELNGIAGEILEKLEQKEKISDIITELKLMYDAPSEQIEKDVEDIIERFNQAEIIRII